MDAVCVCLYLCIVLSHMLLCQMQVDMQVSPSYLQYLQFEQLG